MEEVDKNFERKSERFFFRRFALPYLSFEITSLLNNKSA
jgi:hypothetical protein